MTYTHRTHAGDALAALLVEFLADVPLSQVVVLGLARGGIPVAAQVAQSLGVPFHVFVSKKIGVPGVEEVALGAVAEGSNRVIVDPVAWYLGVPPRIVHELAARERIALQACAARYRAGQSLPDMRNRTVILVDDGMATGATMRAAVRAIRGLRPKSIVVAVPTASRASVDELQSEADLVLVGVSQRDFDTVSASYADFSPVTEQSLEDLLGIELLPSCRVVPATERSIRIPVLGGMIAADVGAPTGPEFATSHAVPREARGLVILAHGGGSSRDSYRNRYLAGRLRMSGYATLRADLLTRDEQEVDNRTASVRFNLARISQRLANLCDWAVRERIDGSHKLILHGASSGAAAAMYAAAQVTSRVAAVITRGGRVDLAMHALSSVKAPALLIVGASDSETVKRNRMAMRLLSPRAQLIRIPGAGHSFDEPGALGAVGEHMVHWLSQLDDGATRSRFMNRWRTVRLQAAQMLSAAIALDVNRGNQWRRVSLDGW